MAGQGEQGDSWWGSWLKTAKEKSVSAFEVVKKDLAEYSCTVHQDTNKAVTKTTTSIKEKLKKPDDASYTGSVVRDGVTHLLESLTHVLTIPPDDDDEEEITITHSSKTFFDRAQAQLNDIQVDSGTYLHEPEGELHDAYHDWLKTFNIDVVKGEISELLVNISEIRALYTKLVPARVSHADFWQRYFYKVHCLNEEETRRKALKCRAEKTVEHEDISWDDDEFESVPISSSPEKSRSSISPTRDDSEATSDDDTKITHANEDNRTSESNVAVNKKSSEDLFVVPVVVKLPSEQFTVEVKQSDREDYVVQTSLDVETVTSSVITPEEAVKKNETIENTSEENVQELDLDSTLVESVGEEHTSETKEKSTSVKDIEQALAIDTDLKSVETSGVVEKEIKMRVKGDTVLVGSDRSSPATSSEEGSKKELSSLDDDWEQEFEVTEEDLKAMKEVETSKSATGNDKTELDDEDDWENWE